MPDYLTLEGLRKRFGDFEATRDVSLSIARSEIVALLGPSGSGKTTVLRLVAGFETPDSGTIGPMSSLEIRAHLRELAQERMSAEAVGLTSDPAYMADLESEILEYRLALERGRRRQCDSVSRTDLLQADAAH